MDTTKKQSMTYDKSHGLISIIDIDNYLIGRIKDIDVKIMAAISKYHDSKSINELTVTCMDIQNLVSQLIELAKFVNKFGLDCEALDNLELKYKTYSKIS
jgi:hypothetical protein